MKLLPVLSASLAFALSASAQYFSQGWQPGQPVTEEARPTLAYGARAPQPVPTAAGGKSSKFDFRSVLTSGPVDFIASKMGLNMTEKLAQAEAAAQAEIWDPRIPVITDASYEEIIVKEPLTLEEEAERMWFLVMYVHGSRLWVNFPLTYIQLGDEGRQERSLAQARRLLRQGLQREHHCGRSAERPLGSHRLFERHLYYDEVVHLAVSVGRVASFHYIHLLSQGTVLGCLDRAWTELALLQDQCRPTRARDAS